MSHGKVVTDADTDTDQADAAHSLLPGAEPDLGNFDYLFSDLQSDPSALLPDTATIIADLRSLGKTMVDDSGNDVANSSIPAAYTYFGQFVDHDITLEVADGAAAGDDRFGDILDDDMRPLTAAQARTLIRNRRTATLDLDSVYGTGTQPIPHHPTDPDRLLLGRVSEVQDDTRIPFRRPPGKSDDNDVPREGRSADAEHDRAALIGDPRNDENTIISQLQVAFLKAHNRLVHEGHDFHQARRILRQHYQHIVVHDFLPRIADTAVVDDIVTNGNRWYDALSEPFFLPLEFSVAAYRFGHTMVRADYDFNLNFNLTPGEGRIPAGLDLLFTFTALSGQLGDFDTLPEHWIIEWQNIIGDPGTGGKARLFDTRLSALNRALFRLRQVDGAPEVDLAAMLSVRNLLRGYRMRMPTGQAVAELLGVRKLTPAELRDHAAGRAQRDVLTAGGFLERTPLWYYVLAEAQICAGGERLGPVGSTIVAEVIIGLVRRSEDSILRVPGWQASLPSAQPARFELADLLRFAGVLDTPPPAHIYVVAPGDTLFDIAEQHLGDGARWPEIFAANRTVVRRFDQIFPGMRLILPSGPPPVPQLRFIIVKPGDTLSGLAKTHLGDAERWPDIFSMNGAVITNPNVIVAGQVLQLPVTDVHHVATPAD
ncbi:peroxidase family protein [Mycobacterium sp. ZZG]